MEKPIIFEQKNEKNYNYIILMNINRKIQRQRVMKRKNMTMQLFKKILFNQISYKKKKNVDFMVNNNGSKEKTRQILKKVLNKIIELNMTDKSDKGFSESRGPKKQKSKANKWINYKSAIAFGLVIILLVGGLEFSV